MCNSILNLQVLIDHFCATQGIGTVEDRVRTATISRDAIKGSGFKSSIMETAKAAVVDIRQKKDLSWMVTKIHSVDGQSPTGEVKLKLLNKIEDALSVVMET
jgi:hypothetical protein